MSFHTDLDHCKLEAVFTTEGEEEQEEDTVLHYEYVSNKELGIRKARVEKRWLRKGCLGRGSFGEVWLEEREDKPDVKRAVKKIRREMVRGLGGDWAKELSALVEFSKTKVWTLIVWVHGRNIVHVGDGRSRLSMKGKLTKPVSSTGKKVSSSNS